MIANILTVCTGNICRSPVAEAALRQAMPGLVVGSAGLHALVGREADADSVAAAAQHGIEMHAHAARQFDDALGRAADLILVMETHHRQEIAARWPHFLGKTFLLGHFDGPREVPDPYRQPLGMHLQAAGIIADCCRSWHKQIGQMQR
jgi:protein-tyrosine phosphatase